MAGLFTRGWISMLTDAELAFLLMAASKHKRDPEGFILPAGGVRMLGIGPETYEAHHTLQAFGLVRVTHQRVRSPNGRLTQIAGGGQQPLPDMVQFLPEGLDQEACGDRRRLQLLGRPSVTSGPPPVAHLCATVGP
ncbi:hypothetical protein AB0C15_00910 [Micromonospora sp. NPDC048835]|uniref:hypothetical protein n=1 Tax=Micromonospora sp. NPDC048835 TaxID=3155147 RepID=UPI0033DC2259